MLKLVEVSEDGFQGLIGKVITVFCARYIYAGELIGINKDCILLKDPKMVYETGSFDDPKWKDAQALPHDWYIACHAIESFGILK